jgi:hypothetical protein
MEEGFYGFNDLARIYYFRSDLDTCATLQGGTR